jgi:NADPH:quinone reductase-like Zn-dependent oxidoreductase
MDRLQLRGLYPWPVALPAIGGAAGCGLALEGAHEGQHVLLPIRCGTWRTWGRVPEAELVPVGDVDPVQTSMLVVNDLLDGLGPGSTVVQAPGTGTVAQLVDQLCVHRGIRCVSLVHRPPSRPLSEAVDRLPKGLQADRAFDGVGGETTGRLARRVRDGGVVLHYGAMSRQAPQLGVGDAIFRGVRLEGYWLRRTSAQRSPGALHALLQELAALRLSVHVAGTWPLEAHREALASRRPGVEVFTP